MDFWAVAIDKVCGDTVKANHQELAELYTEESEYGQDGNVGTTNTVYYLT